MQQNKDSAERINAGPWCSEVISFLNDLISALPPEDDWVNDAQKLIDTEPVSAPSVSDSDFIKYVREERMKFADKMYAWFQLQPADKRVAIEDLLITYDQMGDRLASICPSVQPKSEGGLQWVKGRYDELYRQVKSGVETPCLADYNWDLGDKTKVCRDICRVKPDHLDLTSRGVGYGSVKPYQWHDETLTEEQAFVMMCEHSNVEWIPASSPSTANTEEGAEPAFHVRAETVEEEWNNFWKGIVCNPDGSINIEQVKKELSDFSFVLSQVPKVYCHITGSLLSKVMYQAETVIAKADEYYEQAYEEDRESDRKDLKEQQIALAEWIRNNGWDAGVVDWIKNGEIDENGGFEVFSKSTEGLYELFLTETKQQ